MLGTFNIAVIFTWVAIFLSMIIVFKSIKKPMLSISLVAVVLVFRVLEFYSNSFSIFYIGSVGLLYALAAAVLFSQSKDMIYKQIMFIALINVVFQVLQLSGVWDWPYLFTTISSPSHEDILFVQYSDIQVNMAQARPSGILSSPTWQSLFTGLVIALHFTRNKNIIPFSTLLVILLIILSNSKFPILMLAITWIVIYLQSEKYQKKLSLKSLLIFLSIYSVYTFLFPGIVKITLDPTLWVWSFFVRLNNLLALWYPNNDIPTFLQIFTYGTAVEPGHEDNYFTAFAKIKDFKQFFIFLTPVTVGFIWYYIKKYKALNLVTSTQVVFPLLCAIIVVLYLIMFPILEAHFYYFILGGALLPVLLNRKKALFYAPSVY